MAKIVTKVGRFLYGLFAGLFIGIFFGIFLVTVFSSLYIIGILFKPIPAEVFAILLWIILYSRFFVYLWKSRKVNLPGYVLGSTGPLLLAVFFSLIVCFVRAPFRDGIKTIIKLEGYKKGSGNYPTSISKIDHTSSSDSYSYDPLDDSFSLSYRVGLFETAFYNSKTKKWRGDLPVGGVPYDIIGIEQAFN